MHILTEPGALSYNSSEACHSRASRNPAGSGCPTAHKAYALCAYGLAYFFLAFADNSDHNIPTSGRMLHAGLTQIIGKSGVAECAFYRIRCEPGGLRVLYTDHINGGQL